MSMQNTNFETVQLYEEIENKYVKLKMKMKMILRNDTDKLKNYNFIYFIIN